MLTNVSTLAAYLYLHQADQIPAPILNSDGQIDIEADNAAIEAWSSIGDEISFDMLRLERFIIDVEVLLTRLEQHGEEDCMTLFYDSAKATFDQDKSQIRTWFGWLYLVVFQRHEGPRWGEFVQAYGVDEFVALVRNRFDNLI